MKRTQNTKAANRSLPKQISYQAVSSNKQGYTPVTLRPDHRIVVKHVQTFSGRDTPGGSFDLYEQIQPIKILTSSSYAPLWQIYESVRVSRIDIRVWLTNVSMSTVGRTSAMCFRDTLTTVPTRNYYELIVEPGSRSGTPTTVFSLIWTPIEPSDYEFYDHSQISEMDSGKYGQVNFAGAGFDSGFKPDDLIEYTVHYEFKSLVRPDFPPMSRS